MKASFLALSLFALCLVETSAQAQNDVYNNGPTNGFGLGFDINFGFAVSDQFTLSSDTTVNGLTFASWAIATGDVLETAEVSITSAEFGGTTYLDQVVSFTASGCFSNGLGFNICNQTGSFPGVNLSAGSYWLNLQNGVVNNGDPVFWDVNSGPSLASENSLGTIPSESFTLLGHSGGGGSSPEPSTITLFGSGVLGLTGILRRKLF